MDNILALFSLGFCILLVFSFGLYTLEQFSLITITGGYIFYGVCLVIWLISFNHIIMKILKFIINKYSGLFHGLGLDLINSKFSLFSFRCNLFSLNQVKQKLFYICLVGLFWPIFYFLNYISNLGVDFVLISVFVSALAITICISVYIKCYDLGFIFTIFIFFFIIMLFNKLILFSFF